MTVDQLIAEQAAAQGGHITRAQLAALGLHRGAIDARLARGALIAVFHGVYAVGHLPTNPVDRAHGALLVSGTGSALAGDSALAFWLGQTGDWPKPLELVSATDRRPSGVIVHRRRALLSRDIRTVDGLRVTSPARTALDMAPRITAKRLERIVNELRHERRLTVEQLIDVSDRNPRHPGTEPIRTLTGASQQEHSRSGLEDAFLRLVRRHRLPIPQINVHLAGHRVDAYFPDHGLVVELDGGVEHGSNWRPAFEADRTQMVDVLLETGLPTIRFTREQVMRHEQQTAAKLAGILERRMQRAADPHPESQAETHHDPQAATPPDTPPDP